MFLCGINGPTSGRRNPWRGVKLSNEFSTTYQFTLNFTLFNLIQIEYKTNKQTKNTLPFYIISNLKYRLADQFFNSIYY